MSLPLFLLLITCFNPHRLFPAGATSSRGIGILDSGLRFQSSPAVSSRCNEPPMKPMKEILLFQSSPAVSSRCNPRCARPGARGPGCFNPHRLFPAGATLYALQMRPVVSFNPHRLFPAGATRVQTPCGFISADEFQSSPAVSSRCNTRGPCHARRACCFNPHRLFPAGATVRPNLRPDAGRRVSILTGCFQPVQRRKDTKKRHEEKFQSSPAVSSRCNLHARAVRHGRGRVSILTGCFQPVQHIRDPHPLRPAGVSILTGCFQPVQHAFVPSMRDFPPPFQSSPAVSSRCN